MKVYLGIATKKGKTPDDLEIITEMYVFTAKDDKSANNIFVHEHLPKDVDINTVEVLVRPF